MNYKISVAVKNAKNTCFIAMPFGKKRQQYTASLDVLYDAISEAVNNIPEPLTPYRTDKKSTLDFMEDIMRELPSAKIVVAVLCSLENGLAKPNPNVMYELGIAHALGKPTIILTSDNLDSADLPADVFSKFHVTYAENELNASMKATLVEKIKVKILEILERTNRELVDPAWEQVRAEPTTFCSNVDVRNHLKTIFSFIQDIQHHLPEIETPLSQLKAELQYVSDNGIAEKYRTDVMNTLWSQLTPRFSRVPRDLLQTTSSTVAEVKEAFDKLPTLSASDKLARGNIQESMRFFIIIAKRLREYRALYKAVEDDLGKHDDTFDFLQDEPQEIGDLLSHTIQFENATTSLLGHAHNVILNVIKVID